MDTSNTDTPNTDTGVSVEVNIGRLEATAAAAKENGEPREAVVALEEAFVLKMQAYGQSGDTVVDSCAELALRSDPPP
ncbi:hypothetical protein CYMTET_24970 [Cymbomonas tetramitiformis]|uniref:Uncharacterized protein n=1 Tax=Cymbomonas tetramitiformis TaxID=36881 RepID=A0AAE0KZD3_9CHLO|nr:hypothetical protein CYMTET_24970 [Cymbomonas tetramitiformis]